MVRDAWRCHAPHHEGHVLRRNSRPHPEERPTGRVSKDTPRQRDIHASAFPRRRLTRVVRILGPQKNRGAGNAGCLAHRRPRVRMRRAHEQVTTGQPKHSGIPCANGFNGFLRALPGDRALLSPSPARCAGIVANLTPASRCQDHTTSPSATGTFVSCARASTASCPNVRDDRDTPLRRDGMARVVNLIWVRRETENFCGDDWTGGIALKPKENFRFWRRPDFGICGSLSHPSLHERERVVGSEASNARSRG